MTRAELRFGANRSVSSGAALLCFAMVLLAPAGEAQASHHRGTDTWSDIGATGVVTLHVTTRWSKGTVGDLTVAVETSSPAFDARSSCDLPQVLGACGP